MPKFSMDQPKKPTATTRQPDRNTGGREREYGTAIVNTTTARLLTILSRTPRGERLYLIDTGAGINLIKENKVETEINATIPRTFHTGQDKYTTEKYITVHTFDKLHKFHIMLNDFPIIEDGIIGLPYLEKYNYEISSDKFNPLRTTSAYIRSAKTIDKVERLIYVSHITVTVVDTADISLLREPLVTRVSDSALSVSFLSGIQESYYLTNCVIPKMERSCVVSEESSSNGNIIVYSEETYNKDSTETMEISDSEAYDTHILLMQKPYSIERNVPGLETGIAIACRGSKHDTPCAMAGVRSK
jgi:hypothetical protein